MDFLKHKFYDNSDIINSFIDENNCLLCLEKNNQVTKGIKEKFVNQFISELVKRNIVDQNVINSVSDKNPWSIDFPSWYGPFDEETGKSIFVVGSEPHIYHEYLQTVYGFHNEKELEIYLNNDHPIFRFISSLLTDKLGISKEEILKEVYLTDLFPLSPLRGNGLHVGTTERIQNVINSNGIWTEIRSKYAKEILPSEIKNVKPKIVLTQGKCVFEEVVKILEIDEKIKFIPVTPVKGRKQYIRSVKWLNIPIISVPHIGSTRMRAFWKNNLDKVKEAIESL